MPDAPAADPVARINALTTNARNTWFVLLGALVFVGITLMSVEHIDFYGVNRATKLPLVDVEVPTRYFFIAAPILIAAIYGYFHLYLVRLWDALDRAPARVNGIKLGDAVAPWLITDAALKLRLWLRDDYCAERRPLDGPAMVLNIGLAWGFGLVILGVLWWQSMTARDFWGMTLWSWAAFMASLYAGLSSLVLLWIRMDTPDKATRTRAVFATDGPKLTLLVAVAILGPLSHARTGGNPEMLAEIRMLDQPIVERPAGWLPYDLAKKDFFAIWCQRDSAPCTYDDLNTDQKAEFEEEWKTRRESELRDLRKPDWHSIGERKPDFRDAVLWRAFFSGADLESAKMERANLPQAQMERANLSQAQMQGAVLAEAQMQGAVLFSTQMQGAALFGTQMQGANLSQAQMDGAVLAGAQMEGANLSQAQMEGAELYRAQMEGAVLAEAQMQGAVLIGARMAGAILNRSHLAGTPDAPNLLDSTDLSEVTNDGGALRFVDLSDAIIDAETDFRNAFLDGSVTVPDPFRVQMGDPCQWAGEVLTKGQFYGRWRGWVEANPDQRWRNWQAIAPEGWENVQSIPPPEGCAWKTGPMPGAEP